MGENPHCSRRRSARGCLERGSHHHPRFRGRPLVSATGTAASRLVRSRRRFSAGRRAGRRTRGQAGGQAAMRSRGRAGGQAGRRVEQVPVTPALIPTGRTSRRSRRVPCAPWLAISSAWSSSLAAYQVADIVSKFMAVLLLPVYTRHITRRATATVEMLANVGHLRQHRGPFRDHRGVPALPLRRQDQARRDALARRAIGFLLITTTLVSIAVAGRSRAAIEAPARRTRTRPIVPHRRARAVVVHQPRARLRGAPGRGAAAPIRDGVARPTSR